MRPVPLRAASTWTEGSVGIAAQLATVEHCVHRRDRKGDGESCSGDLDEPVLRLETVRGEEVVCRTQMDLRHAAGYGPLEKGVEQLLRDAVLAPAIGLSDEHFPLCRLRLTDVQ